MTPDQLNILALLCQYFGWCAAFGAIFAGAYGYVERRKKR